MLADSPPTVCKLEIAPHFEGLKPNEKLYAHHISRASFHGTRITLRQVSPESEDIYDLIIAVDKAVGGDYNKLSQQTGVSEQDVKYWVEYAACVLGNLGNYKVRMHFDGTLDKATRSDEFLLIILQFSHSETRNSSRGSLPIHLRNSSVSVTMPANTFLR